MLHNITDYLLLTSELLVIFSRGGLPPLDSVDCYGPVKGFKPITELVLLLVLLLLLRGKRDTVSTYRNRFQSE